MERKITITIHDDETYQVGFEGEFRYAETQTVLLNTLLRVIEQASAVFPEEHKRRFLEDVYDRFNEQATAVLESIIPDRELRQDMDAEAIIAYEESKESGLS